MKNPLTPAGIEPATFRFVAQHLKHCATAVPSSGGTFRFLEKQGHFLQHVKPWIFTHCPLHPNSPLVQQIGNYTLADLPNLYKKYTHKRTKPILL